MPCIQMFTSKPLPEQQQESLKQKFGKAIEQIPGKTEKWLMCIFHSKSEIWFRGEQGDHAFLEVGIYGQPSKESCDSLTKVLMDIVSSSLKIEEDHIYIKYSMTPYWGWNGKNF